MSKTNKPAEMLSITIRNIGGFGSHFHYVQANNSDIPMVAESGSSGSVLSRAQMKKELLSLLDECMPETSPYMGKTIKQIRAEEKKHLGRMGTVIEVSVDEKGKTHLRTKEDDVWCPADWVVIIHPPKYEQNQRLRVKDTAKHNAGKIGFFQFYGEGANEGLIIMSTVEVAHKDCSYVMFCNGQDEVEVP